MQSFMNFYCKKTTCDQKPGPEGLIDSPEAEYVKSTGVKNIAGGGLQLPQATPRLTRTLGTHQKCTQTLYASLPTLTTQGRF